MNNNNLMIKQKLLNTSVNNVTMKEAIQCIERLIHEEKKSYVVAINVDVVTKIENDEYLKMITDNADMVLVDGKPLVWIANFYNKPVKEKVSGSDLVPELCKLSNEKGYSIFILGGKEGVAAKAKQNLTTQFPNLNIVGTYSPSFGFENDKDEINSINKKISDCKPDLLFACFGCPKQEKWIYENIELYDAKVSICAGATVDFLAGNIQRAPKWMSDNGLEWFYRFLKEPKRMFKRYFVDDLKIIALINKYRKDV